MKLVFVNRYFFPDTSATSQLLTDLAQHLAGAGFEVHVIASRQRYDDPAASLAPQEKWEGVRVHRVWTTRFGRSSLVGRSFDYLTFYVSVAWRLLVLVRTGDVVIAETDPPLVSVIAAWVVRRKHAKLINWLQDVFPEVAVRLGMVGGIAGAIARRLRNYSLRVATTNVVLGDLMAREVASQEGVDAARTVVIHNWFDGESIRPGNRRANLLRDEWQLEGKFVVAYSGNLGRAHEFETIVGAAERLREERTLVFLIVGGGQKEAWLRNQVERRGLSSLFQFRAYQPRERLAESLSAADVHLVSLRPELEGLIVPSKFYGIAAVGRPTLFIGHPEGEIPRLLQDAQCGLVVRVGDCEALSTAIQALKDSPQTVERMGSNARRLFEERFGMRTATERWRQVIIQAAGSATAVV